MSRKILLVAGGTGGHILPAIAFGSWAEESGRAGVSYVCGARELESEIYLSAGITPLRLDLDGSPLSGGISLKTKIERSFSTAASFCEVRRILKKYRPDCAVLFGGYLSLPFLIMCRVMGVPAVVHEQNACAGMASRLAAKLGIRVLSGWEVCFPLESRAFTRVGIPVRAFKQAGRAEALGALGVNPGAEGKFICVVFGGSLGSVSMKEAIGEISGRPAFEDWLFLLPAAADGIGRVSANAWALPAIWDPSPLFAAADCAVTRAGGSTLAELAVMGLPALIIPWKEAARNHQYHNASAFLSENTGIIFDLGNDRDTLERKLTELKALTDGGAVRKSSEPRGKADIICERLWRAVASQF